VSLSQFWFAARLGAWLCSLPIIVRSRTLPFLLERIGPAGERPRRSHSLELNRAVQIVARICRMRLFDLPIFPRACLRRALALYYVLTRMGYPVEIHIGVHKDGRDLHGHSWVTLHGKPLGERAPAEIFRTIYSYPAISHRSTLPEINELQPA
jgi:hypothetical protein